MHKMLIDANKIKTKEILNGPFEHMLPASIPQPPSLPDLIKPRSSLRSSQLSGSH